MDEKLKALLVDLANAINSEIGESERVAEVIMAMIDAGYQDIGFTIELSVFYQKKTEEAGENTSEQTSPNSGILTALDEKFLRALNIKIDNE